MQQQRGDAACLVVRQVEVPEIDAVLALVCGGGDGERQVVRGCDGTLAVDEAATRALRERLAAGAP